MTDLIDAAKAEPTYVTYGSWFTGSPGHLGAAILGRNRDADTHSPTSRLPTSHRRRQRGHQLGLRQYWLGGAMYRAGKVKYLAVRHRSSSGYPEVPTVRRRGGHRPRGQGVGRPAGPPRGHPGHRREDQPGSAADPGRPRSANVTAFGFELLASTPGEITKAREDDLPSLRRHRRPHEHLDPMTHRWPPRGACTRCSASGRRYPTGIRVNRSTADEVKECASRDALPATAFLEGARLIGTLKRSHNRPHQPASAPDLAGNGIR